MQVAATRDRLLDTAERLFARYGVAETSLRTITTEAGTNLASVHYHFGSKEALFEAVFDRRIEPVNTDRLRRLDDVESGTGPGPLPLEPVLEAFLGPPLRLMHNQGDGGRNFTCLLGRLYAEPVDHKLFFLRKFEHVADRFSGALARALPDLPPADLNWRFFFMLGSMAFTLGGLDIIQLRSEGQCDPGDVEGNIRRLVAYTAGGFRAPLPDGEASP